MLQMLIMGLSSLHLLVEVVPVLQMSVTTSGGIGNASVTGITVITQGSGYNIGDVLTITAVSLPGPPSNDVLITLQEKDRDIANSSWVETNLQSAIHASPNRLHVSSQDSHAAVRLRLRSAAVPAADIQEIRLMCAT